MSNARNIARLLPNSSGQLPDAAMSSGSVLQVVQGTYSTQTTTTSASYVSTGLAASITPISATSKILVIVNATLYLGQLSAAGFGMGLSLYRGGSAVFTDASAYDSFYTGPYGNYIGSARQRTPLVYLDSPATTNATTYTLYMAAYQGRAGISDNSSPSNITLMEIAA